MKRFLSFILAIAMCLIWLSVPFNAAAEESTKVDTYLEGEGTSSKPYLLYDAEDLYEFKRLVNGGAYGICARLEKDIVVHDGEFSVDKDNNLLIDGHLVTVDSETGVLMLDGKATDDLRQWVPMGVPVDSTSTTGAYVGTFDGNGKIISGLISYYQREATYLGLTASGLFCAVGSGGTVKDLSIVNSYFCGNASGAIAVGSMGVIYGCHNNSYVFAEPKTPTGLSFAGGIVGGTLAGTVQYCLNTGLIKGEKNAGGIVGTNGLENFMESNATFADNYYLAMAGTKVNGCWYTTEDVMKSGEIAWKLNDKLKTERYYQTIDQTYPSFEIGDTVYQVEDCGGYEAYRNVQENYEHEFNEDQECEICGEKLAATVISGVDEYLYVDAIEAFDAAQNLSKAIGGQVFVTLQRDAKLKKTAEFSEGNISLNLNGFKLSAGEAVSMVVKVSGADLIIKSDDGGIIISPNTGTITISSGSLELGGVTVESESGYALMATDGSVLITGGNFLGSGDYAVKLPEDTQITGGQFQGLCASVSLNELIADDCAIKFDSGTWDIEMNEKAYSEDLQIKLIPFSVVEVPEEKNLGAVEGYTAEESPSFRVVAKASQEGTVLSYQWYEVDAENNEITVPGATSDKFTVPTGKTVGEYLYRWYVRADGYEECGDVPFVVVPRPDQPDKPDEPDEPDEPDVPDKPNTPVTPDIPAKPELPAPPSMQEETVVSISDPVFSDNVNGRIEDIYIFLDAAPLQGITLSTLRNSLSNDELNKYGQVSYDLQNNSQDEDARIKTSDRLVITVRDADGTVLGTKTYVLVVMGDTNCDGMALANDAVLMMRMFYDTEGVAEEVLKAADMNFDGKIAANDARRVIYKFYNWDGGYKATLE